MGDGHFTGNGRVSGSGLEFAINGNLEVVGSSVVLTFTDAVTFFAPDEYMTSRVGDATLDISTLSGTANFMAMVWENSASYIEHYSEGLTSVDCEENPDGVDKRDELKRFFRQYVTTLEK